MVPNLTLTLVVLFGLLTIVLFGALAEMFRDLKQLREVTGVIDRPITIDLGSVSGTAPSLYGLPTDLDALGSGLVLFLSEKCGTCRSIAGSLGGSIPTNVWLVLECQNIDTGTAFAELFGILQDGRWPQRFVFDPQGRIADAIGVDTTPVVIHVTDGQMSSASTVPSARHLYTILPKTIRLARDRRTEETTQ